MTTLLKDIYSKSFVQNLSTEVGKISTSFSKSAFTKNVFDANWANKSLKERMVHLADCLHNSLSQHYATDIIVLTKVIAALKEAHTSESSLALMLFPQYVASYGTNDFAISIKAMESISLYTSCEFAVRIFLNKYSEKMFAQMQAWAKHKDYRLRRLASEGTRIQLPWGLSVAFIKEQPTITLPILTKLIKDDSDWVLTSVANHLNDISKANPKAAIDFTKKWIGSNMTINKVLKHGCRTLLKKGNPEVLSIFGINQDVDIQLISFKLDKNEVASEGTLLFNYTYTHSENQANVIRLEYAIYHLKKNGTHTRKVFKISEKLVPPNVLQTISRKHSFKPITTRVYYPGTHFVSIIINGHEYSQSPFELL